MAYIEFKTVQERKMLFILRLKHFYYKYLPIFIKKSTVRKTVRKTIGSRYLQVTRSRVTCLFSHSFKYGNLINSVIVHDFIVGTYYIMRV